MKGDQLRPCDVCASPIAGKTRGGKTIDFHVLVVEHHILNLPALQRHAGLTMMLGSEQLAGVMGSDEDMSLPATRTEVFVCGPCWLERGFHALTEDGRGVDLPEGRR